MKNNRLYILLVFVFILGVVFPGGTQTGNAQSPQPPEPVLEPTRSDPIEHRPCLQGLPCEDENGERFIIPTEETLAEPTAIGDSDDYGYTLTSATYSWIGATDGTNTGIDNSNDITEAISLPFAFPFYGNSYSQLYITGRGYLTFNDYDWAYSFDTIPDEYDPNNFISVLSKSHTYSSSAVYYKNFGTHFVIQWNHLLDGNGGVYTFEAVLYPDGNIKFQYRTLPDPNQGYWCSTSGIENATGVDGLAFWDRCSRPTIAGTAVLFTKPGPSARVGANPLYLGEFASSLDVDDFTFTLTNSGDLGADTYDMAVTIAPLGNGWTADLLDAATEVPLSDTDADGAIDSGLLDQGESKEILVRVSAPAGLSIGAAVKTYIDIRSSLNPAKTKTVTIESTVPAAFAQTYKDGDDNTLRTDLNWPVTQIESDVFTEAWNVNEPAIIETPEHNFVHVWSEHSCGSNTCGYGLRYAVVDRFGQVIKAAETLSPLYDVADFYSYQVETALAVGPDGKIGVVWYKNIYNPESLVNYNIFFAILNPSGTIAYGPVNLTNNDSWGSYQAGNRVEFYNQDISASSDNRFFITWEKYDENTDTDDIYYSIRQSSGAAVVPVTQMTASVPGSSFYIPTAQIALNGNRFFVTYAYYHYNEQYYYRELLYRVFDSGGGTLTPPSNLNFYAETAVQLSGGNILLASQWNDNEIRYQIRSGSTYGLIYESTSGLSHPSISEIGYSTLGMTKDALNRGILTWSNENRRNLYYAYVQGSNGALLSGPVIFHRSDYMDLSRTGSSITTNSWSPAAGVDLSAMFSSDLFGGEPGGVAPVVIHYANIGVTASTSTQLVLTLPAGLSYAGDTSGITPTVDATTITWALPNLAFSDQNAFQVYLAIEAGAAIGTLYSMDLKISSLDVDANPADNSDTAQVFAAIPLYLPLIQR